MRVGFIEQRRLWIRAVAVVASTAASIGIVLHEVGRDHRDPQTGRADRWAGRERAPRWLGSVDLPSRRIAGHVYLGRAPARARVHLRADVRAPSLWRGLDLETDPDGSFDFGALPTGAYQLRADAGPTHVSRVVRVRTDGFAIDDTQDGSDAELYLEPCEMRAVYVTGDPLGAPVEDATLWNGGVEVGRTGHDGTSLVCAVSDSELTARAPGLASGDDALGIGGAETFRIRLVGRIEVGGRVVDARGAPVVGALVQPIETDGAHDFGRWGEMIDAAVTDEDGRFTVSLVAPPPDDEPIHLDHRLVVRIGHREWDVGTVDRRAPTRHLTVRLRGFGNPYPAEVYVGGAVRGHVTCRGAPVADAHITHPNGKWVSIDSTRTRVDGTFVLSLRLPEAGELYVDDATREIDAHIKRFGSLDAIDDVAIDVSCARNE